MAPAKIGGHEPRVLRGEHRDWLLERAGRDFTLRGLVAELAARGVRVRKAAERTVETTWRRIGSLLDTFTAEGCRNYLVNSGYTSA